ncbi:MAG: cobalamin B12-binding domain-containing protein [Candidatus Geothermincolia bacterium]
MTTEDVLLNAVADLDEDKVLELARAMLDSGVEPLKIIETCNAGLALVGERYERREYYLGALIMSGEIFKGVMDILESRGCFIAPSGREASKVLLGVPLGDVHDIGKDIIANLLKCSGFEVVDLGVSVNPKDFVAALRETGARVLGMSVLLTVAYEPARETVLEIERAGMRDMVRIMIGGGAASERLREYAGADAWSRDALDAVKFAREFTGKE